MVGEAQSKGRITLTKREVPKIVDGKRKRDARRRDGSESEDAADSEISGEEDDSGVGGEEEMDTDEEIAAAQTGKSKKTASELKWKLVLPSEHC
jgi:hypothetical protein